MFAAIQAMTAEEGRDPAGIEMIVRANVDLHPTPLADDRASFTGDMAQVLGDIERCRDVGAHEVIVEPQFSCAADSLDAYLDCISEIAAAIIPDRVRILVDA